MKRFAIINVLLALALGIQAQDLPAYKLYNSKGRPVKYSKMIKEIDDSEVVLFGEYHDNAISHWLELEVTKSLYAVHESNLKLGAEMIERDNQEALNAYLVDSIDQKGFDTTARLWNNHKTDYKPLVDFAKEHHLDFVAANIPRRYASLVYKKDFSALDSLSDEEKSWIASLPIPFDSSLSRYQEILKMMGGHGNARIVKAQAIKDATMAESIVRQLNSSFDAVIHYNGAFHSDFYEGISWYINQYRPNTRISTISTVTQDDVSKLENEHIGRADFIIVVDQDVTRTY